MSFTCKPNPIIVLVSKGKQPGSGDESAMDSPSMLFQDILGVLGYACSRVYSTCSMVGWGGVWGRHAFIVYLSQIYSNKRLFDLT